MNGYAVLGTIFLFLSLVLALVAAFPAPGTPDPYPGRFRLLCFAFASYVGAEIVFKLLVTSVR